MIDTLLSYLYFLVFTASILFLDGLGVVSEVAKQINESMKEGVRCSLLYFFLKYILFTIFVNILLLIPFYSF